VPPADDGDGPGQTRRGLDRDRHLVGLIVPSSNPTVERVAHHVCSAPWSGLDIIATRVKVRAVAPGAGVEGQFDSANMAAAARLLVDSDPELVIWAGTSGLWRGVEREAAELEALSAQHGRRVTSTSQGIVGALHEIGQEEVGVFTPYVAPIHRRVVGSVTDAGYRVVTDHGLGETDNLAFSRIAPEVIGPWVDRLSGGGNRPVLVVCTNLLAALPGTPTLDSVIATFWHAARLTGANELSYQATYEAVVTMLYERGAC